MASRAKRRRNRHAAFARRTQPGAPPGFLVPEPNAPPSRISAFAFGTEGCVERPIGELDELRPLLERWPVTWINVDGLGDTTVINELGELFGLHRLALEDVVHTHQRAKAESYGDVYFIVVQMPLTGQAWGTEQISLFIGRRFVLTFQERPRGDCLDSVRQRIRAGLLSTRAAAAGYLAYAILDAIVDNYFPLVEVCGDRLDQLEDEVLDRGGVDVMARIHTIKRDLQHVRRAVWPLREAFNTLLRDPTPLLSEETRVYLRDCHDHTIQLVDLLETYRDIASGLSDVYLSTLGHRTNEIMKVLTIISTIFIPLTFIAGVYGMNFDPDASPWNMPELRWAWGYPLIVLLMGLLALLMLIAFWRRGWLGRRTAPASTGDAAGGAPERDAAGGRGAAQR